MLSHNHINYKLWPNKIMFLRMFPPRYWRHSTSSSSLGTSTPATAQDAEVRWEGGEGTVDFGYCRLDKTWLS